jgi:hypothetical protein
LLGGWQGTPLPAHRRWPRTGRRPHRIGTRCGGGEGSCGGWRRRVGADGIEVRAKM